MDPETIRVVANYGFPAIATVYLLAYVTRSLNGKLDRLSDSVDRLIERFDRFLDKA